jgi:hypothetical protein
MAIILRDSADAVGVPVHLSESSMGNSLGDSLNMLSEALEDIPSVWTQWGVEHIVSCRWLQ